MSQVIKIGQSVINAKIYTSDPAAKQVAQTALSYFVDGAEQDENCQKGYWDGRSTFFDWKKGTFPAGFVHLVRDRLSRAGYQCSIVRKPLPKPLGAEAPAIDAFGFKDKRYDYQPQTVDYLLRHGRFIAQVATGGGKSRIANLAAARIKRPTLFITTRRVLMYQMEKAFVSGMKHRFMNGERDLAGQRVGILGDGKWNPSDYINVAMVQSIAARIEEVPASLKYTDPAKFRELTVRRAETLALLAKFELVIAEEAHEASGDEYFRVMNSLSGAHYRLALTATPFMRASAEDNMRLMAVSGPVAIRVDEKTLIDRGILAKPFFRYAKTEWRLDPAISTAEKNLDKHSRLLSGTGWQKAYKLGINFNAWRNAEIVRESACAARFKLPVLILVQHKNHGNLLKRRLKEAGLSVEFIFGDSDESSRRAALLRLSSGQTQVLIGSTILDVGVDVPSIGLVVLAGGGKAEVALRQRIGRGLRAKKDFPNVAFILDFDDCTNRHLRGHSLIRRAIVESTPGFAENITGSAPFDYGKILSEHTKPKPKD